MAKGLRQKAYDYIKEKVVTCEYLPNSFINEAMLQQDIGASRTPIREALGQLEQEGLVKILPKKGIVVADLSINDINVIYETRSLIEPFIIRKYYPNIDLDELVRMRAIFADSDSAAEYNLYSIDDDLHAVINRACNNYSLLRALEQTYVQNKRVRVLSGNIDMRISQSNEEHIDIIDRILTQEHEAAAQAMLQHLERSKTAAFNRLVSNGGWNLAAFSQKAKER